MDCFHFSCLNIHLTCMELLTEHRIFSSIFYSFHRDSYTTYNELSSCRDLFVGMVVHTSTFCTAMTNNL